MAPHFYRVSALILVVGLPVGMVFSHRGSAAFVASAGLALLVGYLIAHWPNVLPDHSDIRRATPAAQPLLWLFALFFLIAIVTLPMTAAPRIHGWRLLEFAAPVVVTAAMLFILKRIRYPLSFGWLLAGVMVAALLTLYELRNGSPMRGYFGLRVEDWRLNRTVIVLLLLLFPLVGMAVRLGKGWRGLALAVLFVAFPGFVIIRSESGAAEVGLLVGVLTIILATAAWRLVFLLTVFAAALAILTAPWQGIILWDLMPDSLHERLRSMSSAIRVDIWRAFGWAVQENPFFGSGFNTAAGLEREKAYLAIPDKLRYFIEFGHAHNAALQIWVEFGMIGAVIATAMAAITLRRIDAASPVLRPAMLGAFNAAFIIAIVSHGAWQAWWAGAIGAVILLFFLIERAERRREPPA